MSERVSITTAGMIAVLVGVVGFALGRSTAPATAAAFAPPSAGDPAMPLNVADKTQLPPGHPALGAMQGNADLPAAGEASIVWTAPARWKSAANPSAMRIATFKIPHAPGDTEDPELSITQVGGGVDSNIDRWIGQFDTGQTTVKRSSKTVSGMKVTLVEMEGAFSGGMGVSSGPQKGWALLGAIVETSPMPHFFKLTGPANSVKAARAELEAMVDSIKPK